MFLDRKKDILSFWIAKRLWAKETHRVEIPAKLCNASSILILSDVGGRLGNLMFQLASLVGIANHTHKFPIFGGHKDRLAPFGPVASSTLYSGARYEKICEFDMNRSHHINQKGCGIYDSVLVNVSEHESKDPIVLNRKARSHLPLE